MSRTVSPVSGRPYGLAAVCRAWRAPRATVYRRRVPPLPQPLQRPGPVGPMPDAALLVAIRAVVAASPFHGEGHRKIWARLHRGRSHLETAGGSAATGGTPAPRPPRGRHARRP